MARLVSSAFTAILLASTVIASPAVAGAEERHGGRDSNQRYERMNDDRRSDRHQRDDDHGDAAAAAIVGLAIGAILGSTTRSHPSQTYVDRDDVGEGYYSDGYRGDTYEPGYEPAPRTCITREQRWDRYRDRYVTIERAYPC